MGDPTRYRRRCGVWSVSAATGARSVNASLCDLTLPLPELESDQHQVIGHPLACFRDGALVGVRREAMDIGNPTGRAAEGEPVHSHGGGYSGHTGARESKKEKPRIPAFGERTCPREREMVRDWATHP